MGHKISYNNNNNMIKQNSGELQSLCKSELNGLKREREGEKNEFKMKRRNANKKGWRI